MVLAGHGPTPFPEFYMEKTRADAVILGEGEIPFYNLLKALENKKPLKDVLGIAYRDGDKYVVNKREMLIKNLDLLPYPYLDGFPMEYYINGKFYHFGMNKTDRFIGMLSSRGCPYHCNFCQRLESGYRIRSPEGIVEEIKKYKKDYGITFVVFWCELMLVSEKRAVALAEAFIEADLNIRYWCTGRVNVVTKKSLELVKRSGCACIDYGVEQFDNYSLKMMNKNQTEEHITNAIEMTLDAGIQPAFNLIWGNIGDTKESLRKSVDFLSKYNDYGQLRVMRPVTPYPGTPLYDYCVQKGLLSGVEDFYEKHKNVELLTVNLTDLSDEEFHKSLYEANKEIINEYNDHQTNAQIEYFKQVYFEENEGFRGLRHQ